MVEKFQKIGLSKEESVYMVWDIAMVDIRFEKFYNKKILMNLIIKKILKSFIMVQNL